MRTAGHMYTEDRECNWQHNYKHSSKYEGRTWMNADGGYVKAEGGEFLSYLILFPISVDMALLRCSLWAPSSFGHWSGHSTEDGWGPRFEAQAENTDQAEKEAPGRPPPDFPTASFVPLSWVHLAISLYTVQSENEGHGWMRTGDMWRPKAESAMGYFNMHSSKCEGRTQTGMLGFEWSNRDDWSHVVEQELLVSCDLTPLIGLGLSNRNFLLHVVEQGWLVSSGRTGMMGFEWSNKNCWSHVVEQLWLVSGCRTGIYWKFWRPIKGWPKIITSKDAHSDSY